MIYFLSPRIKDTALIIISLTPNFSYVMEKVDFENFILFKLIT